MNFGTSFTHKCISLSLYSALLLVTVSAGIKTINFTLDRMFISSFILGWQQTMLQLQEQEPIPPSPRGQLVEHMNHIESLARKHAIHLPKTNTSHAYGHILKKIGQPKQQIFLLVEVDRFIIYGLGQQTMERIDKQLDGRQNPGAGIFTARQGKNRATYTGVLTL